MSALDKAHRIYLEEAIRAGILPEVRVYSTAGGWCVEQMELDARELFERRDDALAYARQWCQRNPPCVVKLLGN